MTMITPSYLGETIEYSSLHACRSTLEDPTCSAQQRHLGACGRFHDGSLRHREFPGAVDHYQRDARPRDERLQFRLPRRHAYGQSFNWMAGSTLYRPGCARSERALAGGAGSLLPAGATPPGRALKSGSPGEIRNSRLIAPEDLPHE